MNKPFITLFVAGVLCLSTTYCTQQRSYCQYGDKQCWPSQADLDAFSESLNPLLVRNLTWSGNETDPRISAVPSKSEGDQPLYGLSLTGLKPVYVRNETDRQNTCFVAKIKDGPVYASDFCKAAVRNTPYPGTKDPAFVVWPVDSHQVQTCV